MSKLEASRSVPSFKSELKRIWNVGPTEEAWSRDFMLTYAFYAVGKDLFWNLPRTIALTVGHTAQRLSRQTNPIQSR